MARVSRTEKPQFHTDLDVRGLSCPMPALRARIALSRMASGEVLRIVATDRGSPRDFETFAKKTGHRLIGKTTTRKEFVFYLQKA